RRESRPRVSSCPSRDPPRALLPDLPPRLGGWILDRTAGYEFINTVPPLPAPRAPRVRFQARRSAALSQTLSDDLIPGKELRDFFGRCVGSVGTVDGILADRKRVRLADCSG